MLPGIKKTIKNHAIQPEGPYKITAVLLPLVFIENELHILYEVRSFKMKTQPGEVCFPGGKKEDGEMPILSALRETVEELGLPEQKIEIFGGIDTIVTPFNMIVYPFVGTLEIQSLDELAINPDEVDHVFTVPLRFFESHEPEIHYGLNHFAFREDFPYDRIPFGDRYPWKTGKYPVHFYTYGEHVIWGITARITFNFINIIKGLS
ncbi:MAG: hypothetical protein AVO33_08205 [delta proteobacterium ML8_F1]|nr:MAG: hypothetical protein AVO33_08205 [delta proteobacterium ML8_F1]